MKKKYLSAIGIFICSIVVAQVGVNTTSPSAMLDVKSSNSSSPTPQDGLLIPRVESLSEVDPTANQNGMLVYLTNNFVKNSITFFKGFYYWDNEITSWKSLSSDEWVSGNNETGEPLIYSKRANENGTKVIITDDGKFGFGTDNPVEKFEIRGSGDNDFQITSANVNPPNLILYNSGGTVEAPGLPISNQEIGALVYKTNNGNGLREVGGIHYFIDGNPTATSLPTKLVINNTRSNNLSDTESFTIRANGNVGISTPNPTAKLNLPSSNGVNSSAPLKFAAGTNLTVPEAGAMEYDGNNLYFTSNTNSREVLLRGVVSTVAIDFPSISSLSSSEFSITVNGALQNGTCNCSPLEAIENGLIWSCYVSADNTVKIRLLNGTINGGIDPISRNWKITVFNSN